MKLWVCKPLGHAEELGECTRPAMPEQYRWTVSVSVTDYHRMYLTSIHWKKIMPVLVDTTFARTPVESTSPMLNDSAQVIKTGPVRPRFSLRCQWPAGQVQTLSEIRKHRFGNRESSSELLS